jgi:hypothetical protein
MEVVRIDSVLSSPVPKSIRLPCIRMPWTWFESTRFDLGTPSRERAGRACPYPRRTKISINLFIALDQAWHVLRIVKFPATLAVCGTTRTTAGLRGAVMASPLALARYRRVFGSM